MKYVDDFKNPEAAHAIEKRIKELASLVPAGKTINIMEVCGSHTMAIARYAIREILPENINLVSGPGCPVCVTDSGYIDTSIALAQRENIIVATFGDMINVPGGRRQKSEVRCPGSGVGEDKGTSNIELKSPNHQITKSLNLSPFDSAQGNPNTLTKARAEGASVEVCYSPSKALELAKENPDKEIVFLGIGFETTMVPVTAIVDIAIREKIENLSVLTAFKLVPPALEALVSDPELNIDAFLCPAHVSAIIGANAYNPFVAKHHIPCVIASFEPVDIMYGLQKIMEQIVDKKAFVDNQYKRVVKPEGNLVAQKLLEKYLTPADVPWRGIGVIPGSGLALNEEFSKYDAEKRFGLEIKQGEQDKRCKCGDVLKGKIKPIECAMFAKACTPINPIGPCMVSSEGSCAAYYKYR